jgi:hypothetical protein
MVAEAELTILRARTARAQLLDLISVDSATNAKHRESKQPVQPCLASGRLPILAASAYRLPHSVDLDNVTIAYLRALPELMRLDQHERKALSRRRRALRQLVWTE